MKYILLILLVVVLIAISPLLTIWALNTLFPALDIPYTMDTWAAVILLGAVVRNETLWGKIK